MTLPEYIVINIEKTKDTVTEFNTELFEFSIHIQNSHPTSSIYLLGLKHEVDIYQDLDDVEWIRMNTLEPGAEQDRQVYHNIHHDEDIEGPTFYLIERIVGIFNSKRCAIYLEDEKFLSTNSVKINYEY